MKTLLKFLKYRVHFLLTIYTRLSAKRRIKMGKPLLYLWREEYRFNTWL